MVIVHKTFKDKIILFQRTTGTKYLALKTFTTFLFYWIFCLRKSVEKEKGKKVLSTYGYFI
jgi:hypothetical protein